MYRIWDAKEKRWVKENVYLAPNGDMFLANKKWFGYKLHLISEQRYTLHNHIGLQDKSEKLIYEGDIAELPDKSICLVAYSDQYAGYMLFDYSKEKYYFFGTKIASEISVVGNVFENADLLPED